MERLPGLVLAMREACPWTAAAWQEHCEQFRPAMQRISRSLRVEVEHALRAAGMSYRAISAVTGGSPQRVANDCPVSGQSDRVTSLDGRSRPATRQVAARQPDVSNDLSLLNTELQRRFQPAMHLTGESRSAAISALRAMRESITQLLNHYERN